MIARVVATAATKPWQMMIAADAIPPARDGARNFDNRVRNAAARNVRGFAFARGSPEIRPPRRSSEGRTDWQEHPRSECDPADLPIAAPRQWDDSKAAKRPAFGGRAAYRNIPGSTGARRGQAEENAGSGSRSAGARQAGFAPRRRGNGHAGPRHRQRPRHQFAGARCLENDVVAVDGKNLPPRERAAVHVSQAPRMMTTHAHPEAADRVRQPARRPPRLISISRLDFNTKGLLLLTNDGGLAAR